MAHFAKVENGIVVNVIVAEQDFIDSGVVGDPAAWIQTSYNTHGGVHVLGGSPLRKNFAGIGCTYDIVRDAFIPLKEFDSWVLDEFSCTWKAPVPYPDDGAYYLWDENTLSWVKENIDF
jgi:hypothetical protein